MVWVEKRVSPLRSAMKLRCFGRNDGFMKGAEKSNSKRKNNSNDKSNSKRRGA